MFWSDIPLFLCNFFDFLDHPMWKAWPFNSGYGEHILPSIARMVFVTLILGIIFLGLRFLFGPGGPLRDKELEEEAREQTRKEREELEQLLEKGEISEIEYKIRMKALKD